MTDEPGYWWLVTFQVDHANRWALFDDQNSAQYFYNRLTGSEPYRFIRAISPIDATKRFMQLTA